MALVPNVDSPPRVTYVEGVDLDAAEMNVFTDGVWEVDFTPDFASSDTASKVLVNFTASSGAVNNGGIRHQNATLYVTNGALGTEWSGTPTFSIGQKIHLKIDCANGEITVSGATTGNGTFATVNAPFTFGDDSTEVTFGARHDGTGAANGLYENINDASGTPAELAGVVTASATVTGSIGVAVSLSGSVAAGAAVSGAASVGSGLVGALAAAAAVVATLSVGASLAGAVASAAALTGDLTATSAAASPTAHRTSGVAPLLVVFEGYSDPGQAPAAPFKDLDYAWDFDDPTAGTWGTTGESKNAERGPVVAHVFETPGTYNVALQVRGGADGSVLTQGTIEITVDDPDVVFAGTNTVCFSGAGNFTGAPPGAQQVTTSSMATVMTYVATGRRLLLRRGETFAGGGGGTSNNIAGPGLIGAFGSGAAPIITPSGSGNAAKGFRFSGSGATPAMNDWRLVDIVVEGQPGITANDANVVEASGQMKNLLMLRLSWTGMGQGILATTNIVDFYGQANHNGIGIVDCVGSAYVGGAGENGLMVSGDHVAIMGTDIDLGQAGEHSARSQFMADSFIGHSIFSNPASTKACFKFHANTYDGLDEAHTVSQHVAFRRNRHEGGPACLWMVTPGPQNETADERGWDILFDGDHFIAGALTSRCLQMMWERVYARNCIFDISANPGNAAIGIADRGAGPTPNGCELHHNTVYSQTGSASLVSGLDTYANGVARNNLIASASSPTVGASGGGSNTVAGNITTTAPLFATTPPSAVADFAVLEGSPAEDAASVLTFPLRDFAGALRYDGSAPDAGAYELQVEAGVEHLSGVVVAGATVTGSLEAGVGIAGAIVADASVAGSLGAGVGLAGAVAASAALAGAITADADVNLGGGIEAAVSLTGSLSHGIALSGAIAGGAALSGELSTDADVDLSGVVSGAASLTGSLSHGVGLAGALAPAVAVAGDLGAGAGLSGGVAAAAVLSGVLSLEAHQLHPHRTCRVKRGARAAVVRPGMSVPTYDQDPAEVVDYSLDWSRILTEGETIEASVWEVDGVLTLGADSVASAVTLAWASAPPLGGTSILTNTIATSAGRTYVAQVVIIGRRHGRTRTFSKGPAESLDYGFDWADALEAGELVDASAWIADGPGSVLGPDSGEGAITFAWMSAGDAGSTCVMVNTIQTSMGRTYVSNLGILVRATA